MSPCVQSDERPLTHKVMGGLGFMCHFLRRPSFYTCRTLSPFTPQLSSEVPILGELPSNLFHTFFSDDESMKTCQAIMHKIADMGLDMTNTTMQGLMPPVQEGRIMSAGLSVESSKG